MPRQRLLSKHRVGALTDSDELDLLIGPGRDLTAEEHDYYRTLWRQHGASIMATYRGGSAPWAAEVFREVR